MREHFLHRVMNGRPFHGLRSKLEFIYARMARHLSTAIAITLCGAIVITLQYGISEG